jgi:protein-disulfide isomerase
MSVLAGCTNQSTTGGTGDPQVDTNNSEATPGTDGQTVSNHPAAQNIESQPHLGPPSTDATGVVIAFEDPSCSLCRRFETNTLPELQTNLITSGELTFVYRNYPVIYQWGKPATQALESTYVADENAFWALKNHFYAEQSSFGTDNVLQKTESFLADETDVDATAVVDNARTKAHDTAVQSDIDAAEAAGAGSQTPIFYLFRDGGFQTRISGPQGYDVFAAAMGF